MSSGTLSRRGQQKNDGDDIIDEPLNAVAALPQNLAILKMENDSIQSLAAARPRNMSQIKEDLEETLADFPDLAYDAIYAKPVGKCIDITCECGHTYEAALKRDGSQESFCPRCNSSVAKKQSKPHQKFARGLSIRSAETLAEAYGFNRVRADLMPEGKDGAIKIEATFTDYQRGRIWQDSNIVSPFYRGRNGQMQRTPDDRFYNTTVKAEKSKLIREVINRSVHPGLKAWWEATCERIQGELLTDDKVQATIAAFAAYGLYQQDLENIVGKPRAVGWTKADRQTLVEVYNGLKSGDVTVAELLEGNEPEKTPPAVNAVAGDLQKPVAMKEPSTPTPWNDLAIKAQFAEQTTEDAVTTLTNRLLELYQDRAGDLNALETLRKEEIREAAKGSKKKGDGKLNLQP